MNSYFRRQLADYVEYHRDPWNCAMHVFGILFLFTAAVIPLSLWPVTVFGIETSAAVIAVIPVLLYWFMLDVALGAGIFCVAVAMLSVAGFIAGHLSLVAMWSLTAVMIVAGIAFQVIGHSVFERRKASMADNPTHLMLGPMFVMAKLFIALGFRQDLAAILAPPRQESLSYS